MTNDELRINARGSAQYALIINTLFAESYDCLYDFGNLFSLNFHVRQTISRLLRLAGESAVGGVLCLPAGRFPLF
jgi:hypothetical protein